MATLSPFAALRPDPDSAHRICALPYDVMSSEEARAEAAGNRLSFLHVSKPEIDLPEGIDLYSPQVYAKGRENFTALIAEAALRFDPEPRYYLYRQVMGTHSQTGLVALASCAEYDSGVVKKHEFTRPDKEDDRVRHIEALDAQTGPVFLTYPAVAEVDERVALLTVDKPDIDFVARDGVRHSSWTVTDPADIDFFRNAFTALPALYIADGHHRSAAASRVCAARNGAGGSAGFLAVVFPHDQMCIMPYNRVLRDLNGHTAAELLLKLSRVFEIEVSADAAPSSKHTVSLYLGGVWRVLRFRPEMLDAGEAIDRLDVSLLQQQVLSPIFNIEDPRTSKRIAFVGGIRGTKELEKLVDSGAYACAFSMYPTDIRDLMSIADAGGVMPPKSTWFEPKLRDGMFSHVL